jgi:hypothetical protein
MARYYGTIGYASSTESAPGSGVWSDVIEKRSYFGDLLRSSSASRDAETLNKDIIIGNYISVVADEYAINHFSQIKFVELAGHYWEVVRVDVQSPRLLITLGSVYNGPTS